MKSPPAARRSRPVAEPLEGRAYFAPLTFAAPVAAATGLDPAALAVADVNGDGRPDVVTADYGDDTVAVLINTGGGTFAPPVLYPVGVAPQSIAVGDFNGDGHPDVVTANAGDGTVSVLDDTTGAGTPVAAGATFAAAQSFPAGPDPTSLAAGDLNGDGLVDLVTATPDTDTIHVLLNKGNGTFPLSPVAYATNTSTRFVGIADVNSDGRPDVLVTDLASATVSVFAGVGDGTLRAAVVRRTGGFPFAATAADLTGDNRADLITADNRDDAVGVLVHNADGTYNHWRTFPVGTPGSSSPEAVAVADVDGDGKPDVITADFNDSSIGILLNRTAFTPLTATTLTLTPSQNPVQAGNPLTLTATVSPAPTGSGRAVQFVAGSKVIGFVPLAADGTATLTTTAVPVGTTSVLARFPGNGGFAISSATVDETVLTAAASAPLVAATGVAVTSPAGRVAAAAAATTTAPPVATTAGVLVVPTAVAVTGQGSVPIVAGDAGTADITVADPGSAPANGMVTIALSATPAGETTAFPLAVTSPAATVALAGGADQVVPVAFTIPATLAAGSYTVAATLTPVAGGFTTAQVSTAAATTAAAVPVVLPFVPGDAGSVAVTVTNQGPGQATGAVSVSLSIASVNDPAAAVPLAVAGASTFAVDLRGGASRTVPVRFTLPATIAVGAYTVLATLTPARGLAAGQVSPAVAATATAVRVVLGFGTVGVHRNYTLTTTLGTGAVVRLSLAGPGTGSVVDAGGGMIDLTVGSTGGGSTLTVTPVSGAVSIAGLTDPAPLGTLDAAGVPLTGALTLGTGVRRLTLGDVTGGAVTIGPVYRTAATLGTVAGSTLFASGIAQSIAVTSWAGGTLTAAGVVGSLSSTGDFAASLSLTGVGLRRAAGSIAIGGAVTSPTWLIGASVGPIRAGSIASGFTASVAGTVASLTVAGDLSGVFVARDFGPVAVGGNLTGATVLAGATLDAGDQLGGGNDTFNVGRIASVQVGGNVVGSVVAAGLRPASDAPFTPVGGTLLRGGAIGRITVGGTVDAASLFLAASVPPVG